MNNFVGHLIVFGCAGVCVALLAAIAIEHAAYRGLIRWQWVQVLSGTLGIAIGCTAVVLAMWASVAA